MLRFIIKRVLTIIPVVLCVAIVIFTILYISPGDPVATAIGSNYSQEAYDTTAVQLGIARESTDADGNKTIVMKGYLEQLGEFLFNFFIRWDFGTSWEANKTNVKIAPELFERFPRTLVIAVACCVIQILVAIPLGITAATHQNSFIDKFCIILAMIGISVPGFWIGLLFILLFSLKLGWLPTAGVEHWYSYILPIAANALLGIGSLTRMTRSQMLEVIRSDYVTTARAKGVPERTILYSHALPNAMIPIVTFVGTHFGRALGGTVVIETVFNIPGVGMYIMTAVRNANYPVVRSGITLVSVMFCVIVLLVDISYAFIDPRIKAQYENSGKKRKKANNSGKGAVANA